MNAYRISALIGLLVLACQNTGAVHVQSAVDETVDFSRYRTYAQAPPPQADASLPGYSEIAGRRLEGQIATRLEQAGLAPAVWADADLQVVLSLDGRARTEIWDWHVDRVTHFSGSVRMLRGSLQIDAYDRERKTVVWQGLASQETMDATFSAERGIRAVDRLLDRWPGG